MARPKLNPFDKANACQNCPANQAGSATDNDETSCCAFVVNGVCTACTSLETSGCTAVSYKVGFYETGAAGTNLRCSSCAAGSITDTGTSPGATTCTLCVAGSYSPSATVDCAVCSAGKYSTAAGRTTDCDQTCIAGTYLSDTTTATKHNDQGDCTVCSAGKYSTGTRRTTDCDPCMAGTYLNDTTTASKHDNQTDCTVCSAAKYSTANGTANCVSCIAGKYSDEGKGSTSADVCKICDKGQYSPTKAAVACVLCPKGM